jgi:amino acid permease
MILTEGILWLELCGINFVCCLLLAMIFNSLWQRTSKNKRFHQECSAVWFDCLMWIGLSQKQNAH